MANDEKHNASIVSITGESNDNLNLLANLYYEPFDSESVLSVVTSLSHKPDVKGDTIYSTDTWCTSMDKSKGGILYVVSMEGELHIFRNMKWTVINLLCPDGLNSVWAASDYEAFAVGLKGEQVRVINEAVTLTRDPNCRRLNAVHGTASSNVYAVGDDGLIFHFDGYAWTELKSPTASNLLAVLCISDKEVYVAGTAGALFKWDGVSWKRLVAPKIKITSLAMYQNVLYAAAGSEGVFILQKKGLQEVKKLLLYRLKTIDNLLFGVGNRLVAQFDGTNWWGGNLDL